MGIPEYILHILARRDGPPPPKDAGQELLDLLKDPFSGQLAAASLVSALGSSLGFTAFIAICFSFVRPYNQAIYAPKLKHADEKHAPPPIGKKPWSWITPLTRTTEAAMVQQIGMDATIFLCFVRMCRNMFLVLMIIGVGILLPVNVVHSVKEYNGKGTDWTMQITPRDVYGNPQWVQVVVAWLFNFIIMGFLWWNYKKVLLLRRQYFESEEYQNSLHSRTLMLYDLPKQSCSDEGIARIIDHVVPNSSFARTAVARNVKDLPDLIDEHSHAVRKLEKILAKYLKNPTQLPAARPTCKPSKRDRSFDTYPKGQKLDAIDYYTQRIRDLEIEIKEVRASVDRRGTMPYGFASYTDIAEAHSIGYACRNKKPQGATVTLAPKPSDVIWRNMPLSGATRSRRRWINNFWIAILTLLWVGPNAMIAIFLVNLSNLGKVWPAFQQSLSANTKFWGLVQGIASPALTSLVYLFLPAIFRRLSVQAGDQTKTGRDRHVVAKMYSFFVFNNLVVFSFFSTIWAFVAAVLKQTDHGENAWKAIQTADFAGGAFMAFCSNSPFWVTYLLQRQLGAAIDLAQLWPLLQAFLLKTFSSPTPRELIELTAPPPFDYASYYNYFLFYATVTLCFAGIQPLVLVATAMYFCIDSYLKKYLILYRFVTKTESGGLFWRVLFNRLILATILSNLVVMLTCWVRGEGFTGGIYRPQFYAVTPLPFTMIIFKVYCRRAFDDKIRYYSTHKSANLQEAALQKETRLRNEKLSSRFGHPALYKPLITPMVHSKAQNLLPSVYRGRLTDGREAGAGDLMSVSGYSDMYALDSMQGGRPGKSAKNLPGFEYVSESQMDFEYYKNRAEFTEQHGGGEMYGRPSTPGSVDEFSERSQSRSASPLSRGHTPFTAGIPPRRMANMPDTGYSAVRSGSMGGYESSSRGRSPLYAQDNGSSSGLVRHAAGVPMSPPIYSRDASVDRVQSPAQMSGIASPPTGPGPSVGALGGGPRGYTGLAQGDDVEAPDADPTQYSYFRGGSRPTRQPGEGW
ncbi:hypothetical protein HIM_09697 [Hirsutella minnesotensis 3608]|uniref:CSC1/OSCA1-like 7TM region domain-containing protein n=1 Tax=Hirsutella minnesotensis 3608 TaxID=1043627 RepID=A0A0F8A2Y8_9HYPO|nr:hypothetical protein HIM_09697 [Hirsutella minnesotensis 3608]